MVTQGIWKEVVRLGTIDKLRRKLRAMRVSQKSMIAYKGGRGVGSKPTLAKFSKNCYRSKKE